MFELHHHADDHLAAAGLLSLHETAEAAIAAALEHAATRPPVIVSPGGGGIVGQIDPARRTRFTHTVEQVGGETRILVESLPEDPRFAAEYRVVPA